MNRYRLTIFFAVAVVVLGLMTGGFTTFAQFNIPKIGADIEEDVQEAQGQAAGNLAQGLSQPGGGAASAEEPVIVDQLPDDKLLETISAVNEYRAFADAASKMVRAYIAEINVSQDSVGASFEPGTEPWMSEKSELRYSPFDAELTPATQINLEIKPQLPYLPPLGPVKEAVDIDLLQRVVLLRMITKQGDEFVAVAEIAGNSVTLNEGMQIPLPKEFSDVSITVQDISLNAVEFVSGGDSVIIYMGGPAASSEDFQIAVGK